MRKLPVFFLIDVSESMVGEPLELVRKGMESLIRNLKKNPYALETVWIEIVAFAGKAKVIEPYEELSLFYPPDFPVGGGTALGQGLKCLMNEIDANVKESNANEKGDWKPLVFIFTDGQPTDDYESIVSEWEISYKKKCITVISTLEECCSNDLLNRIASDAIMLDGPKDVSFESYFKWITDSIVRSSTNVSEGIVQDCGMKDIDRKEGLSDIDLTKRNDMKVEVDNNYVVLLGACQKTGNKYLIKYKKGYEVLEASPDHFSESYRLKGAFVIDYDIYQELSQEKVSDNVKSDELKGVPHCPECSSPHAGAICECGGIFCVNIEKEEQVCSWCGRKVYLSVSNESVNIKRRLG